MASPSRDSSAGVASGSQSSGAASSETGCRSAGGKARGSGRPWLATRATDSPSPLSDLIPSCDSTTRSRSWPLSWRWAVEKQSGLATSRPAIPATWAASHRSSHSTGALLWADSGDVEFPSRMPTVVCMRTLRLISVITFALALLPLSAASSVAASAPAPAPAAATSGSYWLDAYNATNAERAKRGLAKLRTSKCLATFARAPAKTVGADPRVHQNTQRVGIGKRDYVCVEL